MHCATLAVCAGYPLEVRTRLSGAVCLLPVTHRSQARGVGCVEVAVLPWVYYRARPWGIYLPESSLDLEHLRSFPDPLYLMILYSHTEPTVC